MVQSRNACNSQTGSGQNQEPKTDPRPPTQVLEPSLPPASALVENYRQEQSEPGPSVWDVIIGAVDQTPVPVIIPLREL